MSQTQQKLAKKITYFTIKLQYKYSFVKHIQYNNHFPNLNSLNVVKGILSQHNQKPYFTNFAANVFLVGVRKNNCTAPFLDVQEVYS